MCQETDSMQATTNLLVLQVSFPGVSVADQERANVRPPNPSLCVGNGFVIEITDLVCSGRRRSLMHQCSCSLCLSYLQPFYTSWDRWEFVFFCTGLSAESPIRDTDCWCGNCIAHSPFDCRVDMWSFLRILGPKVQQRTLRFCNNIVAMRSWVHGCAGVQGVWHDWQVPGWSRFCHWLLWITAGRPVHQRCLCAPNHALPLHTDRDHRCHSKGP